MKTLIDIGLIDPFFSPENKNWCDHAKLERYVAALSNEAKFPPIEVVDEVNGRYTVYDGHHRWMAHKIAGVEKILANI